MILYNEKILTVTVMVTKCRMKVSNIDIFISKLNDQNYPVLKIFNSTVVYQLHRTIQQQIKLTTQACTLHSA